MRDFFLKKHYDVERVGNEVIEGVMSEAFSSQLYYLCSSKSRCRQF